MEPDAAAAPAETQPDPMSVLVARNVFRFRSIDGKDVPIVSEFSLDLGRGEFVTIMGPSGSGKSTLLHMLAGLDRPSSGEVIVAGKALAAGDEEHRAAIRRRHIGFIFQFFHLLPDLTVLENVTLPLRILGQSPRRHRDRIANLLDLLGVAKLGNRLPSSLSGGEMQRVSIARALSTQPPLILADEPTGNLSSKAGEEVVGLLGTVRERLGTSVLLVTHNPRDAACGDRVLFLHDGVCRPEHSLEGGPFDVADVFHRLEELGI